MFKQYVLSCESLFVYKCLHEMLQMQSWSMFRQLQLIQKWKLSQVMLKTMLTAHHLLTVCVICSFFLHLASIHVLHLFNSVITTVSQLQGHSESRNFRQCCQFFPLCSPGGSTTFGRGLLCLAMVKNPSILDPDMLTQIMTENLKSNHL